MPLPGRPQRRYSPEEIAAVRRLYRAGVNTREIARIVGASKNAVWRLTADLHCRFNRLTDRDIEKIRAGMAEGKTQRAISEALGVNRTTVERHVRAMREADPEAFPSKRSGALTGLVEHVEAMTDGHDHAAA